MADAIQTLSTRLQELDSRANQIPRLVLAHFARALRPDLEGVVYLDMSIELDRADREFFGALAAITDAGALIELAYHGEAVESVTVRPLRGHIAKIELVYDKRSVETFRIPPGSISIILDDAESTTLRLPLMQRADPAGVLAPIVSAVA